MEEGKGKDGNEDKCTGKREAGQINRKQEDRERERGGGRDRERVGEFKSEVSCRDQLLFLSSNAPTHSQTFRREHIKSLGA